MQWHNVLEELPKKDGIYYVYILNLNDDSKKSKKCKYQMSSWHADFSSIEKIIAWSDDEINNEKQSKRKNIMKNDEKLAWIKENIIEIHKSFPMLKSYNRNIYLNVPTNSKQPFCIVDIIGDFDEMINQYSYFYMNGYVKRVLNRYVVLIC